MPQEALTALPVLAASFVTTAAILLLAWFAGPQGAMGNAGARRGGWAVPLAFGLAFTVAFFVVAKWRGVQLIERWHWLLPMVLSAMALGLLAAACRHVFIASVMIGVVTSAVAALLFRPPAI